MVRLNTYQNRIVRLFQVVLVIFMMQLFVPSFDCLKINQQSDEEEVVLVDLNDVEDSEEFEEDVDSMFFPIFSEKMTLDILIIKSILGCFNNVDFRYCSICLEVCTPPPK